MKPYFITPQHPKATIEPTREAIGKAMALGFAAQRKVNGHRAQIHVSAEGDFVAFTRQGTRHTQEIPEAIKAHFVTMLRPEKGWNVVDAEWQKQEGKIYLFDLLSVEGRVLHAKNYLQRYELLLEKFVLGPGVSVLPLLRDLDRAMAMIADQDPFTEGLVLRNINDPGFHDSAIIRVRKYGVNFVPQKLT